MALNAANIRVGAARIYMGTVAPPSGNPLTFDANGVPLESDYATPSGTEVGLTEGEAVFTYEVTYLDVMAEQSLAIVGVFATEENAQLEFTMKEITNDNIAAFLSSLAVETDGVGAGGLTDIFEGGHCGSDLSLTSLVLVAPACGVFPDTGTGSIEREYIMLFQAYQSESSALRFTKGGEQLMKVTYKGVADLTRQSGRTLFQIGIERYA